MKYVLSVLLISLLPGVASADPDLGIKSEMTNEEVTKVIAKLGSPDQMKSIKTNGNHLAMVWQYKGRIDGKDLYVITNKDGQVSAVTVGGQTVAVVKQ